MYKLTTNNTNHKNKKATMTVADIRGKRTGWVYIQSVGGGGYRRLGVLWFLWFHTIHSHIICINTIPTPSLPYPPTLSCWVVLQPPTKGSLKVPPQGTATCTNMGAIVVFVSVGAPVCKHL